MGSNAEHDKKLYPYMARFTGKEEPFVIASAERVIQNDSLYTWGMLATNAKHIETLSRQEELRFRRSSRPQLLRGYNNPGSPVRRFAGDAHFVSSPTKRIATATSHVPQWMENSEHMHPTASRPWLSNVTEDRSEDQDTTIMPTQKNVKWRWSQITGKRIKASNSSISTREDSVQGESWLFDRGLHLRRHDPL